MKYAIVDDCGFYYCGLHWLFCELLESEIETPAWTSEGLDMEVYSSMDDAIKDRQMLDEDWGLESLEIVEIS